MHPKARKARVWVDGEERDIEFLPRSAEDRARLGRVIFQKWKTAFTLGRVVSLVVGAVTLFLAVRKIRLKRGSIPGMGPAKRRRRAPKPKSGKHGAGRIEISK